MPPLRARSNTGKDKIVSSVQTDCRVPCKILHGEWLMLQAVARHTWKTKVETVRFPWGVVWIEMAQTWCRKKRA